MFHFFCIQAKELYRSLKPVCDDEKDLAFVPDSWVDDIKNPTIYIITNKLLVYPRYLVEFASP